VRSGRDPRPSPSLAFPRALWITNFAWPSPQHNRPEEGIIGPWSPTAEATTQIRDLLFTSTRPGSVLRQTGTDQPAPRNEKAPLPGADAVKSIERRSARPGTHGQIRPGARRIPAGPPRRSRPTTAVEARARPGWPRSEQASAAGRRPAPVLWRPRGLVGKKAAANNSQADVPGQTAARRGCLGRVPTPSPCTARSCSRFRVNVSACGCRRCSSKNFSRRSRA